MSPPVRLLKTVCLLETLKYGQHKRGTLIYNMFHLDAKAMKHFRGYVAIFFLVVVYSITDCCLSQLNFVYIFSSPKCNHGTCKASEGVENICMCQNGWQGKSCDQCIPYWECPNQQEDACVLPSQCICNDNTVDPKGLCHNEAVYPGEKTTNIIPTKGI